MRSIRQAIDDKCKDCIYDPRCGGGTWREQIAKCSSVSCPLWPVRTGPEGGPLAVYPTDPATVTPEWKAIPVDSPKWAVHQSFLAKSAGPENGRTGPS